MDDPVRDDAANDAELVQRMARGDREALAVLFQRFGPKLLALGTGILRSGSEAEDVMHDVFLEAWRAARSYDPDRGTVRAWLNVRMRSRCLDRRKSALRSPVVLSAEIEENADLVASSDPSEFTDQDRMVALLCQLPDEQRDVLVLGYFEGLSCTEMGVSLGIPVGTVKSRVRRALAKLRELLGAGAALLEDVGS